MALFKKDPFAGLRTAEDTDLANDILAKPFDALDASERGEFQQCLLDLYNEYAPPELVNSDGELGSPTELEIEKWRNIIFHAIVQDSDFQRLVVDERISPGTHLFSTLIPRLEWMIGIFLPGFYHHFTNFEEGYNKVLKHHMLDSIHDSRFVVDFHINNIENDRFSTFSDNEEGQKKPPYWSTKSCVSNLFLLCQDEKTLSHCRLITHNHLQDLSKMLDIMPSGKKLADRYKASSTGDEEALVDRFGEAALNALPTWARFLEKLKAIEVDDDFASQLQDALRDTEMADGAADEDEAAGSSVPANGSTKAKASGINPDAQSFDEPFGLQQLYQRVEKHYESGSQAFYYPGFEVPTVKFEFIKRPAHSLSQFDSQVGESVLQTTDGHTLRRSEGFKRARMISREKQIDLPQYPGQPSANDVLNSCAKYLAEVASDDGFHKQGFNDIFNSLSGITTRPKKVQKLSMGTTELRGFSDLIMRDNWWHVRCLFEAVKVSLVGAVSTKTKPKVEDAIEQAELNIAILVSMVGGGADDPLPWVLVVESRLRATWKTIQSFTTTSASSEIRLLFTELAIWVNGTIVNAYVLRCPLRTNNTGTIVSDWYKLLYEYNSSSTSCGTSNTIVFIFWFSHLFHNERCKFSRGKHPIMAF